MWLPILGLVLGIVLGQAYIIPIPAAYAKYLGVAVLAALDSVFGGIKGVMLDRYDSDIFLSGFFFNALLAFTLTFVGDRIGLPLYYAAIFVFGTRLFTNLAIIRRTLLDRWFPPNGSGGKEDSC